MTEGEGFRIGAFQEHNPLSVRRVSGSGAQATEKRANSPFVIWEFDIVRLEGIGHRVESYASTTAGTQMAFIMVSALKVRLPTWHTTL